MRITVFTPTYNRGHLLTRLYESLRKQTFKDFEWVIVDDGSTDETRKIVSSFVHDNQSSPQGGIRGGLRYFYQENGGKHRAINRGVKEAKGELFFIVDSDDALTEDALEFVNYYYLQVKDDVSFGGVCGYMAHHDGSVIGRGCEMPVVDANSLEIRYKYHIKGDMMEVFCTSVLKENLFPEIEGEKFCSEALVWNRIARKYKLRVFNKVIYYRDYLDGGLTDKIVRIRMKSPIASMMTYAELNSYNIPFASKIKAAINYWRFRFCYKGTLEKPKLPWYWVWTAPIGYMMHLNDVRKLHEPSS